MNNDVSNDETYNHFNYDISYKSSIISSTLKAIMKMSTKKQQIMCSRRQCLSKHLIHEWYLKLMREMVSLSK